MKSTGLALGQGAEGAVCWVLQSCLCVALVRTPWPKQKSQGTEKMAHIRVLRCSIGIVARAPFKRGGGSRVGGRGGGRRRQFVV